MSVLLVDDFQPFRVLVASHLRRNPELQLVAEVSDGLEAIRKAQQLKPDVILLDIALPKLNGIEAARQICEIEPQSRIIFLTQERSSEVVQEAIRLGAMGYVAKTNVMSDLLKAIEVVLQGKLFVSGDLSGSDHEHYVA